VVGSCSSGDLLVGLVIPTFTAEKLTNSSKSAAQLGQIEILYEEADGKQNWGDKVTINVVIETRVKC